MDRARALFRANFYTHPPDFFRAQSIESCERQEARVGQLRGGKKASCGAHWLQTHAIGDAGPYCGQETLSPFRHKILRI